MSFWGVVFVVLMLLWLFGGVYVLSSSVFGLASVGGTFLPWCCVAILGYVIFARKGAA